MFHMGRRKKEIEEDIEEESEGQSKFSLDLTSDTKRSVAAVFSFVFAFLFVLGYIQQAGLVGKYLDLAAATVFGWGKWLFPFLLVLIGLILLRRKIKFYIASIIGLAVAYVSVLGLSHVFYDQEQFLVIAKNGEGGGMVGYFLVLSFIKLVGFVGAIVLLIAFLIVGVLVAYNFSLIPFVEKISSFFRKEERNANEEKDDNEDLDEEQEEDFDENEDEYDDQESEEDKENREEKDSVDREQELQTEGISGGPLNIKNIRFEDEEHNEESQEVEEDIPEAIEEEMINERNKSTQEKKEVKEKKSLLSMFSRKKEENENWELPPINLLVKMSKKPNSGNVEAKQQAIEETLGQFGIAVESEGYKVGPTVTQYRFRPAPGVRLEKIVALGSNLAMELEAHPIRIEAPIPGKSLVGIEVPNKDPAHVNLRQKFEDTSFYKKRQSKLTLILGKDVSGEYVLGNLDKMPHLLIAGATNTGKSVCINALLLSLLYQCTPDELKFILVDPKRVELSLYEGIPHLITPVIVENKKAVRALKWAVGEMERRLMLLSEMKSRNIHSYNEKVKKNKKRNEEYDEHQEMPYIIIVIDELADLMITNGKDIEGAIVRLAQMARAVGIHLIVSTQKPIADVITSLIKSNITTRIAFKVATQVDSRTILDKGGAERLVGKGDMLYSTANSSELRRIQGVLVTEKEVKKVVNFLRDQKLDRQEVEDELFEGESEDDDGSQGMIHFDENQEHEDTLFDEAKEIVLQEKKASTSLLQRRLRIGYNRAARLIDELESGGVIGPQNGSKPREVLMGENLDGDAEDGEEDNEKDGYEEEIQKQKERDRWQ